MLGWDVAPFGAQTVFEIWGVVHTGLLARREDHSTERGTAGEKGEGEGEKPKLEGRISAPPQSFLLLSALLMCITT
eukprot:6002163-Pleurochrysis_carterae.AAC.1